MPILAGAAPAIAAAVPAVTAAVSAAAPAVAAAAPAISAAVPAIAAAAPAIAGAVPAIAGAAPAIAGVAPSIAAAAPAIAETAATAAPLIAEVGAAAGEVAPIAAEVAPALAEGGGLMSQLGGVGGQMSTQAPSVLPFAEGGPLMGEVAAPFTGSGFGSTPAGVTGSGGLAGSGAPPGGTTVSKTGSSMQKQLIQAASKGFSSMGESMGGDDQQQAPAQGPVQFGAGQPPASAPYRSGNADAQRLFSENLMSSYLSSGGAFYG